MLIGIDASRAFVAKRTGTENYSFNLINALAKMDRKNQYRLYVKGGEFEVLGDGRNLNLKPIIHNLPGNFQFVPIFWPRLWTQLGLAWEVLKNPPDVLFIPAHTLPVIRRSSFMVNGLWGKFFLKLLSINDLRLTKYVVTIHDLGYEFLPRHHTFFGRLLLNRSTEFAVKFASRLIAVSNATKADLVTKLAADPNKIEVVYEGVNSERFKVKGERGKVGAVLKKYYVNGPYVLFVGTIQPRKNLERLIEAFAKIGDRLNLKPYPLNLVIAGKKGWMYDDILTAPKKLDVEAQVKFLEYVSDSELAVLYKNASVFVMPSLAEGFGLPVLEAMASGVPVAVSDIAALQEIAGEAALYFNPYDVEQMAGAIIKLLSDDKLREKQIKAGNLRVKEFSWEKCAGETLRVLEEVAKQ